MILEVSWDGLWALLLGSHNFMFTILDVEGLGSCVKQPLMDRVQKPTPYPKPIHVDASQLSTLYCLEPFPSYRSAWDPGVTVLGAIRDVIS